MTVEKFYPIERGRSVAPKKTVVQVNFSAAFVNGTPRVVLSSWNGEQAWLVEVADAYFRWDNASPSMDVTIDWIAVG